MNWRFILDSAALGSVVIKEPLGWDDVAFNVIRDEVWHGVFFEYTQTLRFINDGFRYIKELYTTFGIEAQASLLIEYRCDYEAPFEEVETYRLNFTKVEFEEGELCVANINIEMADCLMTMKNRQDTKVNLEANESFEGTSLTPYSKLGIDILFESKTILKHDDFENLADNFLDFENTSIPAGNTIFTLFKLGFESIILNEMGTLDSSMVAGYTLFTSDFFNELPPLLIINEAGTYNIDLSINLLFEMAQDSPSGGISHFNQEVGIVFSKADGTTISSSILYTNAVTTGYGGFPDSSNCSPPDSWSVSIYDINYTNSINLQVGDQIRLYAKMVFQGVSDSLLYCERVTMLPSLTYGNYFKAELASLFPATPCKSYLINEALSRTVETITDDCLRVYSSYFGRTNAQPYTSSVNGCGSLECITTGLHIRRFPAPLMVCSFKDLFEGLNPIHNIGIGMEPDPHPYRGGYNMLRIEPMKYFYQDVVMLQLDKIANVKIRALEQKHYAKFKFGYAKWEAEEFTGLDEFNTKREYRTTLTTVDHAFEKISKLVASGYAIEVTRRKQYTTTTTVDWRYDNDIFIVCLMYHGGYLIEQGNISSPANLIDPATVINFRISPNRNALRWLKVLLNSYHDPSDPASQLIFTSGDGNYLAEGKINNGCNWEAGVLSESESLEFKDLNLQSEGIHPYANQEIEFEYPLKVSEYKIIKANPRRIIQIRWGQNTDWVDCYIHTIEYKPNEGIANFKLYPKLDSTTDVVVLTHYRGIGKEAVGIFSVR